MSTDLPSYPTSPAAPGGNSRVTLPKPPSVVTLAFWGYLLVAVLEVVVTIISVVTVAGSSSKISGVLGGQKQLPGRHISVETVVAAGSVAVVVIGVFAVALYVVFAILLRRGYGWARIVLLVVTVVSLLGVTGDYGLSAVKVLIAVAATVLVFLRPAGAWFRSTRQIRTERQSVR